MLIKNYIENNIFLSKEEIENYKNLVFSSEFPWFLNQKTDPGYEHVTDDKILTHTAYLNNFPNSEHCNTFIEIFDKFCFSESIFYRSILRIRLNLLFSRDDNYVTGPHVDFPFDHNAFLYYFNDSDGDTIFYKEEFYNSSIPKSLEEDRRFSPVAGKAIAFSGKKIHSPSSPSKNRTRITLNIDFI